MNRESVRSHLPHHVTTTAFGDSANLKISHFSRSLNLKHKEKKEEGEGEKEEMKGNVVVAHLGGGMEVLHLFSGRTLCYVPFSPGLAFLFAFSLLAFLSNFIFFRYNLFGW